MKTSTFFLVYCSLIAGLFYTVIPTETISQSPWWVFASYIGITFIVYLATHNEAKTR
jgi:hypothetical protein